MKNLNVRPEYPTVNHVAHHSYCPPAPHPPMPSPPPIGSGVAQYAGAAFSAMKAVQDEYGRNIPDTYAEQSAVDYLQKEVRSLSDKERNLSLTGDVTGTAKFNGKNSPAIEVTVNQSAKAIADGEGNNIADTYARADALNDYIKRDEIEAKTQELENAALAGAQLLVKNCLQKDTLEFATESDINRIFRWGRA